MLENIAESGDAITAEMPTALTGSGVAASNLRHIRFTVPAPNTVAAPTINIGSTGAVGVYDNRNVALAPGDLQSGRIYEAKKVGNRWRLMSPEVRKGDLAAEAAARSAGDGELQVQVTALNQKIENRGAQISQLQEARPYAGDPAVVAEDGNGNAAAWFDENGNLRVPGLVTAQPLAGDDGLKVLTDAAGRPLIWVNMLLGKMGFTPIDWSSQTLEGFDWGKAFSIGHAGDPLVLMEDAAATPSCGWTIPGA